MSLSDSLPTKPFWMVLGDGVPRVRHDLRWSAEQEAKRLARLQSGTVFIVLEAVGAVVKDDLKTVVLRGGPEAFLDNPDDGIPF